MIAIEALRPILDDAHQVYVAVRTKSGPHVTPELFAMSGDRLVCLAAASTLKVKRARRDPIVALSGRTAKGMFAALAHAEVFDPADPKAALESPAATAASPLHVARFVRDNVGELTGAVVDALCGRLGAPPARRVALVLTIDAAVVAADGRMWVEGWPPCASRPTDDWDGDDDPSTDASTGSDIDLADVPPGLRDLVVPTDVVLGWTRADGTPLALPARWEEPSVLTLPQSLFAATGAAVTSASSVTFDEWTGFGPSGKQGVMLRGAGSASSDGDVTRVVLDVDRATHWDGIDTATADVVDRGEGELVEVGVHDHAVVTDVGLT